IPAITSGPGKARPGRGFAARDPSLPRPGHAGAASSPHGRKTRPFASLLTPFPVFLLRDTTDAAGWAEAGVPPCAPTTPPLHKTPSRSHPGASTGRRRSVFPARKGFLMRLAQIAAVVLINAWALSLGSASRQSRAPGPKAARQTGEAPFPASVSFHPDLTYCTPDARPKLEPDLALPAGKGPSPAVVFIHGGGWLVGSRKTYLPHMTRLVEEGYVAVSVSYRLGRKNPFPAPVHDVKCAVRWLRA